MKAFSLTGRINGQYERFKQNTYHSTKWAHTIKKMGPVAFSF